MRYCVQNQLSVVVPNSPGQIARLTKMLLDAQINISAVMFVDTTSQGIVRFIVDKHEHAQKIFEDAGFFVVSAEVVEVELPNTPGALHNFANALGAAAVNIDYAYGSDNPNKEATRITFKLSDLKKGLEIIKSL